MIRPEDMPVLTAAAMRAAEERVIAAGAGVTALMERAGTGVAQAVHRLAAGSEVLVLCGPGNNGGDGYVAARVMRERGMAVRVAASAEPRGEAAVAARAAWTGAVEPFPDSSPAASVYAAVVVDAVFGTGQNRALDGSTIGAIGALVSSAPLSVAVDLPSGVATDTGEELNPSKIERYSLTLALGALKPAHVLQPAAAACGEVRVVDIGLGLDDIASPRERVSPVRTMPRPRLSSPRAWSHKYTRGMVAVVAGAMHGASELAARAAFGAGAGYVLLLTGNLPQPPHAIVRRKWSADALDDARIGAVVIGPGLGRDDRSRERLAAALASTRPLVIDGDAVHLLDLDALADRTSPTILTPHAGEFAALFGEGEGSKIDRTRAAARASGATVVHKGADTVIASPNGWANVAVRTAPWLSTAGTGDVLAGAIGAMLARRDLAHDPLGAASAGVWLHTEAALRSGAAFLADDLAAALPTALSRCL